MQMSEPAEEQKTIAVAKVATMATFHPDDEHITFGCFQKCRQPAPIESAENHRLISTHTIHHRNSG